MNEFSPPQISSDEESEALRIKTGLGFNLAARALSAIKDWATREFSSLKETIIKPALRGGFNIGDVRYFGTIANAIASIPTGTAYTLYITNAQTLTGNLTIPSNISLVVLKGGSISGAYTLTINGAFEAGSFTVFGSTTAVVFGSGFGRAINVKWFGATGDGSTSDTAFIQAAIESGEAVHATIYFPPTSSSYLTGVLKISNSITLEGQSAKLLGSGTAFFVVDAALDFLVIRDFIATWSGASGNQGREFLVNYVDNGVYGENTTSNPTPASDEIFAISRLELSGCRLGHSKVTILSNDTTETVPWIHHNEWRAITSAVTTSPTYLRIGKGTAGTDHSEARIEDNVFDVYPPDSSNTDIVKITGGTQDTIFRGNYLRNRNAANATAQVDCFTGGDRLRFSGNTMLDVQLHYKASGTSPAVTVGMHYLDASGNFFQISQGARSTSCMYLVGSKYAINHNQFEILETDATKTKYGIHFDAAATAPYDSDFGSDDVANAHVIANNLCNLVGCAGAAASGGAAEFMHVDSGTGTKDYFVITGNLLLGGERFCNGSLTYSAGTGNVWGLNTRGVGTGFLNMDLSVAVGNVTDGDGLGLIDARQSGNVARHAFAAVNSGTDIPADDNTIIQLSGSVTIATVSGGNRGQILYIYCSAGTNTITHNSSVISLNGAADFTMTAGAMLTLFKDASDRWQESARKDPSFAGTTGSGVDNRVAVWSGTRSLDSDSTFTFDGTSLAAPTINLNGAANATNFAVNAKDKNIATSGAKSLHSFGLGVPGDANNERVGLIHDGSNAILRSESSGTGTTRPLQLAIDSTVRYEISAAGAHTITGNVTVAGNIRRLTTTGITASTTQTQGQGSLTSDVNIVSTCANANDTVTLPAAVAGMRVYIRNNGAQTLQIFPASGDAINGAAVDASTTLATNGSVTYNAADGTNWYT